MKLTKHLHIVKIEILSTEWDYVKGQEILVPVLTTNKYHAERKVNSKFWGSEYPSFDIKEITKCDTFLFSPII